MASVSETILTSVKSIVQGLSLDGIQSANIMAGKVPTSRKDLLPAFPGVLIAPYGNRTIIGGTNRSDDYSYTVLIAMLQASNTSQTENRDRAQLWSERIVRAFVKRRLSGVSQSYNCTLTSDVKFDAASFTQAMIDINVIQLAFITREARG